MVIKPFTINIPKAAGWACGEPEFGGMGMPKMLGVLVDEMAYSACNAFTLYGSLTAGLHCVLMPTAVKRLKRPICRNSTAVNGQVPWT